MESEPVVCAVMLTRDRPAMAARAVESFRRQTYERKRLLVYNQNTAVEYGHIPSSIKLGDGVFDIPAGYRGYTIGRARNEANQHADYDIIAHWDDDDWSHPDRLAEQVALLQSSGADCVCYTDMLFWDTRKYVAKLERRQIIGDQEGDSVEGYVNEAWLYTNPAPVYSLGSSMLYWRKAWERTPFDDIHHGEDERWMLKVKTVGMSSLFRASDMLPQEPRMVCGIHGGNSSPYRPESAPNSYRRVPEFDAYCSRVMSLEGK